jgi:hypothetical protein
MAQILVKGAIWEALFGFFTCHIMEVFQIDFSQRKKARIEKISFTKLFF